VNITAERGINDNNFNFFLKKIHFPAREKKPMISFFYKKKKAVEEIKFISPRNVKSK